MQVDLPKIGTDIWIYWVDIWSMPGSEKLEVNAFAFCFRAIDVSNVPQRMTLGRLCWTAVLTKLVQAFTFEYILLSCHVSVEIQSEQFWLSFLGAFNTWGN